MTKSGFDRLRRNTLSRRGVIGLASAGTVFTFWQRKVHGLPAAEHYVDRLAADRVADRDPARPPILVDAQTHVWWRAGGIPQMSERGEHFLKSLAGSRAAVVGHPVPVADMGRVMFLETTTYANDEFGLVARFSSKNGDFNEELTHLDDDRDQLCDRTVHIQSCYRSSAVPATALSRKRRRIHDNTRRANSRSAKEKPAVEPRLGCDVVEGRIFGCERAADIRHRSARIGLYLGIPLVGRPRPAELRTLAAAHRGRRLGLVRKGRVYFAQNPAHSAWSLRDTPGVEPKSDAG